MLLNQIGLCTFRLMMWSKSQQPTHITLYLQYHPNTSLMTNVKRVCTSCAGSLINPKPHVATATEVDIFACAVSSHDSVMSKCYMCVTHWNNECSCTIFKFTAAVPKYTTFQDVRCNNRGLILLCFLGVGNY